MRRILLSLALFAGMAAGAGAAVVSGTVTCNGTGVASVAVSDGSKVVLTAKDGSYTIKTPLELGYVFISVPSGYEVPADGVIPRFFKRLDPSQKKAVADFELRKVDQSRCNIIFYNDIHLTGDPVYFDLKQVKNGFFADVNEHYKTISDVPVYAITLGDMTTDSRWYKRKFGLPEYLAQIEANFPVPVYHTMGNHDNNIKGGSDMEACRTFREVVGPYYYSLNIGGWHFVALDDIVYDMPLNEQGRVEKVTGYKTYVEARQLNWLKNDLKHVSETTPVVILTHAPLYRIDGVDDGIYKIRDGFTGGHSAEEVLYFLRKYRTVHLLSGHTHMNYYIAHDNGMLEHNCVSVAGSSWYTESCCGFNMSADGTPGGYAVYTIDNGKLSWYYKAAGMDVEDCQFRAYDINAVPAKYVDGLPENSILVNVFNYDPEWKVSIRENGRELDVHQVWVRDPLYAMGVEGQTFSKKGAFKPHKNSHMFTAKAGSATSAVEITVTDRFGRVFSKTLERPGSFSLEMPLGSK